MFRYSEVDVYAVYSTLLGGMLGESNGVVAGGGFLDPPPTPAGVPNDLTMTWTAGKAVALVTVDTQDNYDLTILAVNTNNTVAGVNVYIGTQDNLQWSNTDGTTFVDITVDSAGNTTHADYHALAVDGPNAVLAGTDGGIWSLNTTITAGVQANTWTDLNSDLAVALVTSVSSSTNTPGDIVIGTQAAGIDQYDGSPTWTVATVGAGASALATIFPYGASVAVDPSNPTTMFAFVTSTEIANPAGIEQPGAPPTFLPPVGTVIPYSILMESTNGGASWLPVPDDLSYSFLQSPALAVDDAGDPDRVVTAATNTVDGNLYFDFVVNNPALLNFPLVNSTDGGNQFFTLTSPTFSLSNVALATYQGPFLADPAFPTLTDQGANNPVPGTFYVVDVSTATPTIYLTRDGGQTWAARPITVGGTAVNLSAISDIEVDPSNSNVVYALNSGPAGLNQGRVFESADGGQTWNIIGGLTATDGLPDVPAWKLVSDPRTGDLFVGTDQGVYELAEGSSTWAAVGTGLPQVQVKDLYLNPVTDTLIAATYGRGVYEVPLDSTQANAGALTAISGDAQWAGPVVLTGATTLSADGSQTLQNSQSAAQLTVTGTISDLTGTSANDNALTVGTSAGAGTVTFSGANTYTGATTVADGVLLANNLTALGSTANGTVVTVEDGAALDLESSVDAKPLTLMGDGPAAGLNGHNTGALESIANDNTYAGPITLASTNVTIGVASGSTLTITGAIGGSGNLIKELTGTLALDQLAGAPDTYTGATFVYQGRSRSRARPHSPARRAPRCSTAPSSSCSRPTAAPASSSPARRSTCPAPASTAPAPCSTSAATTPGPVPSSSTPTPDSRQPLTPTAPSPSASASTATRPTPTTSSTSPAPSPRPPPACTAASPSSAPTS